MGNCMGSRYLDGFGGKAHIIFVYSNHKTSVLDIRRSMEAQLFFFFFHCCRIDLLYSNRRVTNCAKDVISTLLGKHIVTRKI